MIIEARAVIERILDQEVAVETMVVVAIEAMAEAEVVNKATTGILRSAIKRLQSYNIFVPGEHTVCRVFFKQTLHIKALFHGAFSG